MIGEKPAGDNVKCKTVLIAAIAAVAVWFGAREIFRPYVATALSIGAKPAATIDELTLDQKIPLGEVKGRIDHLAIDPARKRLFVAELGNNSVAMVDLAAGALVKRLTGFKEPQGVAFAATADRLFVANGGNGVVEIRKGDDLTRVGETPLGDDADNIRLDKDGRIVVGYGAGALAVIDPASGSRIADIPLAAHPESFQIEPGGDRIFVNEPRALRTAVIDSPSGKEIARWGAPNAFGNFAMALDAPGHRLFVVYRMPAVVVAFDTRSGEILSQVATCLDADDVFHDAARSRVYVICGEGAIAVLDADERSLRERARLQTRSGARTGLFASEPDRIYVAIPAHQREPAEIWAYRPR